MAEAERTGRLIRRAVLAAVVLCVPAVAAAPAGRPVAIHLKSGRVIHARLVAQDAESVTVLYGAGTVRLPRASIDRIDKAAETDLAPVLPAEPKRKPPPGRGQPWPAEAERKVEALLDRYFAAQDAPARAKAFEELQSTPLKRRRADLERMREIGAQPGRSRRHVPVPWRKQTPRGWYNLDLPAGYTPAKAWPLVLALHGMPSNGDNLLGWYSRYFPPRGYIVLYPTTVRRSSFWPAPEEKRELLRLLRHLCRSYRIDYGRIYCTGASGGGIGTWHWLVTAPELFAGGISFSAAGTIVDKRLARLKGVPFYVHHGTKDYIPIASVRRSVEAARRHGADQITFHVSEGTGHTPPGRDWTRAFDWLVKLPTSEVSPRYLLESDGRALPLGYRKRLPFTVQADPAALEPARPADKAEVARWKIPPAVPADDLLAGLVAVGRIVEPGCTLADVRGRVGKIAQAVRKRAGEAKGVELLNALNEEFFQSMGFAPDPADPAGERPAGLAVGRVLATRCGSVPALVGLYAAVAGELALPVAPVVCPYHAFARYDDGAERINVEMAEAGGSFDDNVYAQGYGLPAAAQRKRGGAGPLLAMELGSLAATARGAGETEKARALAKLALSLDAECYAAIVLSALDAKEAGRTDEALKTVRRLGRQWPAYAAPRLLEAEALQAAGRDVQAVRAYRAGIAAPLKPRGAEHACTAEMYYRIAQVYAPRVRQAQADNRLATFGLMRAFHDAIVQCLNHDPRHEAARKLFVEMGGRFIPRARK